MRRRLGLVGGVLLALVAGCRRELPAVPSAPRREVRDGLGRVVRLPPATEPRRIVSLAPSSTEILFALGAAGSVVGVDRYSDFPPAAKRLPQLGADVDPNLERLLALRPDVVFTATSANTQRSTEAIERLGVPVFVSRADSFDDVLRDIEWIGAAVDQAASAKQLVARLRGQLAVVAARHRGEPAVRTLVVVWSEPLVVAGPRSHLGDLLTAAGGENIAADAATPFPTYSLERAMARDPAVILVGSHAEGSPPLAPLRRITARAGAARPPRVVEVDGDLLFRPGPRLGEGLLLIERALHPGDGGAP